jgi:tRNA(Ile)-lysidine synthase
VSVAEEILAAVRDEGLLALGRPVLVMLSGGRDSTCLLDVAVTVAGTPAVTALHVNYGLRDAAEADEQHCRSLCERLGVELAVTRPGAPTLGNLQAWARDARYGAAAQLSRERGADVAAGHTATDQVETILYRLASSPSRRALLGMRPRDGALVRPLLGFTREQTGAHCIERGLEWRDDESNETDRYARGRVRNRLVPALREIHPGAERNLLALAATLRDEADVLDALVDQELGGRAQIELPRLRELPVAVARLVVQRLADRVAGRPTPGTARRLNDILALRDVGTTHVDLPGGVRATANDGLLEFSPTPGDRTAGASDPAPDP